MLPKRNCDHEQELTTFLYSQAQFLREYKLVVVGGGGECLVEMRRNCVS